MMILKKYKKKEMRNSERKEKSCRGRKEIDKEKKKKKRRKKTIMKRRKRNFQEINDSKRFENLVQSMRFKWVRNAYDKVLLYSFILFLFFFLVLLIHSSQ